MLILLLHALWYGRLAHRDGCLGRTSSLWYNCGMEEIVTDIYTFDEFRRSGYTYIDKTDRILPLVDLSQGNMFFRSVVKICETLHREVPRSRQMHHTHWRFFSHKGTRHSRMEDKDIVKCRHTCLRIPSDRRKATV